MSVAARCLDQHAVVQRRIGEDVLDQQHSESAHQFGGPVKTVRDRGDLVEQVTGPVGVGVVIEVAGIEHRVQQLLLRFEVMQQPRGRDPGLAGDLGERRAAPAVAGEQALRDVENPLLAVLPLGEKGVVSPCDGHQNPLNPRCIDSGKTNLVNTTVG